MVPGQSSLSSVSILMNRMFSVLASLKSMQLSSKVAECCCSSSAIRSGAPRKWGHVSSSNGRF